MKKIETFQEWDRNPSYHGSYDDYVAHMKASFEYYKKLDEDRLAKKIAKEVALLINKNGLT